MNEQDRIAITKLEIRVGNIEKGQEKILINHLPHLQECIDKALSLASKNSGKIWAIGIVLTVMLALVIGLYFT